MTLHDLISALLIGAVVGTFGRLALPGRQNIGVFVTLLIGIAAAFLGTYLVDLVHWSDKTPQSLWFLHWNWITLGVQIVLAAVGTGLATLIAHSKISDGASGRKRTRSRARA